jgi:sugar/nucleoside kinase (ribokinase family)
MVDVAVAADALRRGGDVHGEVRLRPGGAGANAAVWAASTGATARLHGRVGHDLAGRLVREALERRSVEPAVAVDPEAPTGTMLVVHEAGERSMVADRGANGRLSPEDLPGRLEAGALLVSGYAVLQPGSEAAALAALEWADAGVVAVDAASWPLLEEYGAGRFLAATGDVAGLVLANEAEARALTGVEEPDEAARKLASVYGAAAVKLGPRGAIFAGDHGLLRDEAARAEAVDPTGAGDAFDGVLLAGLAAGDSPASALRRACEAGARCAASPDPWPEP